MNIARTRSFPGADIGSDHDLLMTTFHIRLKRISKPKPTRIKFDIENLKDLDVAEAFKAMIGRKFAPFIILDDKNTDVNLLTNTFNKIVTDTASEILGKHRRTKKTWVTADILDLCDKRRELKRRKCDPEGAAKYREVNKKIKQDMRRAKDNWIAEQCCEIEDSLSKNNSKKAYQIVRPEISEERDNYHIPRQIREMPDRRTADPQSMDIILPRTVQPQHQRRLSSTKLSTDY